jgi:hypothetical protein
MELLDDIIKDGYIRVMKKDTTLDKLELLMRFLKMRYNISISKLTLEKRHQLWKKNIEL